MKLINILKHILEIMFKKNSLDYFLSKLNYMNSEQKYYLELLPYDKAYIAKSNNFKFDMVTKKWYTHDENHPLLQDFKKVFIDFKKFKKENYLYFDNDSKQWYTFSDNKLFSNYYEDI